MSPKPRIHSDLAGHALYLDIDGTILDLAPSPDSVEVPVGLVPLLQRLSLKLDGAVAFVSGRSIAAIDALFQPLKLPAIGVHGGEIRVGAECITIDESLVAELQHALPLLREAIAPMQGVWLENKRCAIALHYRKVPERGREVLKVAELVVAGLGPVFAVLVGKCVVEIRPRHLTKGLGMQRLMEQEPFRGRSPIFAGDDVTDEDAFELVNQLGGISVRVGAPAPTVATCTLADPDQLRRWLLEIA
ncbi:MAG TPA: trehalose-phosphatase [Steroidobacteraceae bacterium]|nr:trehalose-phosphatase [Steroidobacteraceae bacterium]